jgi:hypothetical protein
LHEEQEDNTKKRIEDRLRRLGEFHNMWGAFECFGVEY